MAEELEFEFDKVACLEEYCRSFKSQTYPKNLFSGKGKELLAEALDIVVNEYAELHTLDFNGYLLMGARQLENFFYEDKTLSVVIDQSNREIKIKGVGDYSDVIDISIKIENDQIKIKNKSHYSRATKDHLDQEVFHNSEKTFDDTQAKTVEMTTYSIPKERKDSSDFYKVWYVVLESWLSKDLIKQITPDKLEALASGKELELSAGSNTITFQYDENIKNILINQTGNDSITLKNYTLKKYPKGKDLVSLSSVEQTNIAKSQELNQDNAQEPENE